MKFTVHKSCWNHRAEVVSCFRFQASKPGTFLTSAIPFSLAITFLLEFLFGFLLAFSPASVHAEYLTQKQAGFRNIALCYENPNAVSDYFKPMLVKFEDGVPTTQTGFDSFLFLRFSIHGKKTEVAACNMEDFEWFLTSCFEKVHESHAVDVPALNQAVAELKEGNFLGKETNIQVMFAIPWLNPTVTDFGDVDGDGVSESLAEEEGRKRVLNWFMNEIIERLNDFPELSLWGFYMMREGLGEKDLPIAKQYCDEIHKKGLRALWIPYFNAGGIEKAYDVGMDAVIMQSNWTFRVNGENGARRNRLMTAAETAKRLGLGIELEINPSSAPLWRRIFLQTLETGTQTGFQNAPSAAYFGSRFNWPTSDLPEDRELYAVWMDYLAGKPIHLPKDGHWESTVPSEGTLQILFTLQKAEQVRFVDIFLDETQDDFFAGLVQIETRNASDQPWKPAAWKLRTSSNKTDSIHQNITLELPGESVSQIRIRMKRQTKNQNSEEAPDSASIANVVSVEVDASAQTRIFSESYRKPYKVRKSDVPVPTSESEVADSTLSIPYPDESGRKLLDGVSGKDWSKNVGWQSGIPVSVQFDFNNNIYFDEIRIYAHPGPDGGIHLPNSVMAIFSESRQSLAFSGFGKTPKNLDFCGNFHFEKDGGFLCTTLKKPVRARTMSFFMTHNQWLFLSEFEFFLKGRKLDPAAFRYTFSEQVLRTSTQADRYPDDGKMLTDGLTSANYTENCTGIHSGQKMWVTLDLKSAQALSSVTIWTLDGDSSGVVLPAAVSIRLSEDGQNWSDPQSLELPAPQKLNSLKAVPLTQSLNGARARFLEVEISPVCWAFLSEIIVEKKQSPPTNK